MKKNKPLAYSGLSMWPIFKEGDLLFSQDVDPSSLKIGDILILSDKQHGELVAHRLVQINPFQTKGDRSPYLDPKFEILSLVTGFKRGERLKEWGSDGPPFKKFMAWLSWLNQKENFKLLRYLALIFLWVLNIF